MSLSTGSSSTSSYRIKTISISSDCSNTWGLAEKASVDEYMNSHDADLLAHYDIVANVKNDIVTFIAVSGVPHLTCLFDAYGNKIWYDGSMLNTSFGGMRYAVFSSLSSFSFEEFNKTISDFREHLLYEIDFKQYELSAGENIEISESNVISKPDTTYILPTANETVLGGVTVVDSVSPLTSSTSSVYTSKSIIDALSVKQNKLEFDGSLKEIDDTLCIDFGDISYDSYNKTVTGGKLFEAINILQDTIIFDENDFQVTSGAFKDDLTVKFGKIYDMETPLCGAADAMDVKMSLSGKMDTISFSTSAFDVTAVDEISSINAIKTYQLYDTENIGAISGGCLHSELTGYMNAYTLIEEDFVNTYGELSNHLEINKIDAPSVRPSTGTYYSSSIFAALYGKRANFSTAEYFTFSNNILGLTYGSIDDDSQFPVSCSDFKSHVGGKRDAFTFSQSSFRKNQSNQYAPIIGGEDDIYSGSTIPISSGAIYSKFSNKVNECRWKIVYHTVNDSYTYNLSANCINIIHFSSTDTAPDAITLAMPQRIDGKSRAFSVVICSTSNPFIASCTFSPYNGETLTILEDSNTVVHVSDNILVNDNISQLIVFTELSDGVFNISRNELIQSAT